VRVATAGVTDQVGAYVDQLVEGCRWPPDMRGSDVMNWVAAAVVAAGRTTYEDVLASAR
jgi:hypothetical protein